MRLVVALLIKSLVRPPRRTGRPAGKREEKAQKHARKAAPVGGGGGGGENKLAGRANEAVEYPKLASVDVDGVKFTAKHVKKKQPSRKISDEVRGAIERDPLC